MAERWLHCAEVFQSQRAMAQQRPPAQSHRRSAA
jgi:hypothetical protein